MAKEPTKGSQQSAAAKLKYAAATVHTYESFGRAVVAAALAQSAKMAASGKQSAITATVNVAPIEREGATFDLPGRKCSKRHRDSAAAGCHFDDLLWRRLLYRFDLKLALFGREDNSSPRPWPFGL